MKILKFNESVRDQMKPRPMEEMKQAIMNLTPYGMSVKLDYIDYDDDDKYTGVKDTLDIEELRKISEERIDESLKELDGIFEKYSMNEVLRDLIPKVNEWIGKNGGNPENMKSYGFTKMAEQIWDNGIQWRHDVVVIYDNTVFDSFRQLLKNVAICEAKYNNIAYEN